MRETAKTELMKFSLRTALASLWALIVALCLALAFFMFSLFELGPGTQLREGKLRLSDAIGEASRRYDRYRLTFEGKPVPLEDPQMHSDLESILSVAFSGRAGVEGGFWQEPKGSLVYAFPTHDGPRKKTDLPETELGQIQEVIRECLTTGQPKERRFNGETTSILLKAQPLNGPPPGLVVWAMTRVPLNLASSYGHLGFGLGSVLLLALGSGIWLLISLRRWTGRISLLEDSLATSSANKLASLPMTGERELDRIVTAFNSLNERLRLAREDAVRLNRDLSRSERLASLGRMAAGLVHEIGNPLATMRLRCENALVGNSERSRTAIEAILPQITRLDELLGALRLLTRATELHRRPIELLPFLKARLEEISPAATQGNVQLQLDPEPGKEVRLPIDERSFARAVDNLLLNAIQHTPQGGKVILGARVGPDSCQISVRDTGPGVIDQIRERIFEPFVTSRADGMGLGLSLVLEIAEAHGGSARCLSAGEQKEGATFVIDLPYHGENSPR